ncbi:MAG: hypothetical protein CVV27_11605 [Candidatus Melainabacteria bacterium HGW-Melainabacteria-1]|nr:MAG: hypothetical protein CVV27_11605 [Candidatus Melainabacteria bacterium HGW-Melainabacteria-1]
MQDLYELTPPGPDIRRALAALCARDPDFLKIEAEAGPLTVMSLPPNFAALVRIIVGQQLATQAARSIFRRLEQLASFEPAAFLQLTDAQLSAAGLSRAKIACCRATAQALVDGSLDLESCRSLPEAEVLTQLTRIKGIGPWSAEIFMLFALGRLDVFPAGDLALQRAYARIKGLNPVPDAKSLARLVTPLSPYRGAAALLLWHDYRHA